MKIAFEVTDVFLHMRSSENKFLVGVVWCSSSSRNEQAFLDKLNSDLKVEEEFSFSEGEMCRVLSKDKMYCWDTFAEEAEVLHEGGYDGTVSIPLAKKLLELWIRERKEFENDPELYKQKIEAGEKVFEID